MLARSYGPGGTEVGATMDPVTPAIAAFKVIAERLLAWRKQAEAAAETREAKDAATTVYFAGLLLAAIEALDSAFRTLSREIKGLEVSSPREEREALATQAEQLAESEILLNRLGRAAGYLEQHADKQSSRLDRMLQGLGKERSETETILREFARFAAEAQEWIGAREKAPTPAGIEDVVRSVRAAEDTEQLNRARWEAGSALDVIDRLEVRQMHQAFGRLTSALSRAYGLTTPEWETE